MPFAPEAHLSGIEKIRKRKRDIIMRSDSVKTGTAQAPHRSLFNALGFTEEERRRPMTVSSAPWINRTRTHESGIRSHREVVENEFADEVPEEKRGKPLS